MKSTLIIFATALSFSILAVAAYDRERLFTGKETTIGERYMRGKNIVEIAGKAFDKLSDGAPQIQLSRLMKSTPSNYKKHEMDAVLKDNMPDFKRLTGTLKGADVDHDGFLSREEFVDAVRIAMNQRIIVKAKVCKEVKKLIKPCKRGLFSMSRGYGTLIERSLAKRFVNLCNSGFTSPFDFPVERCILDVSQKSLLKRKSREYCYRMKSCVSAQFGMDEQRQKERDIGLVNHKSRIYEKIGWIGFFGVVTTFLLGFIPILHLIMWPLSLVFMTLNIGGLIGQFRAYLKNKSIIKAYDKYRGIGSNPLILG